MLVKKEDMITNVVKHMKDGNGICHVTNLCDLNTVKHSRMFSRVEIKPNSSIGLHTHFKETEYYYVLEGKAVIKEKGTSYNVKVGDLVITGNKESHSLINDNDESCIILALIILD